MNRTLKSVMVVVGVPIALNIVVAVGEAGASVHQVSHAKHKSSGSRKSATTGPVGATIDISGAAGAKANVTLVKIIDPGHIASQFISAPAGSRFVATEFRLVGSGANLFASADSVLSVTVTGSNNQVYKSVKSTAYSSNDTGCKNLSNEKAAISRGQSVTGCVNFTLPTGVTVSKVAYDEAGGSKGLWNVS
jgi:hypothetical protein